MPNTHSADSKILREILRDTTNPIARGALKRAVKNALVLETFTAESLQKYGLTKRGMKTPNIKNTVKKRWGRVGTGRNYKKNHPEEKTGFEEVTVSECCEAEVKEMQITE